MVYVVILICQSLFCVYVCTCINALTFCLPLSLADDMDACVSDEISSCSQETLSVWQAAWRPLAYLCRNDSIGGESRIT